MITKSYVEFLTEFEINSNQFVLLWCIMEEETELLKSYLRVTGGITKKEIKDLISKEYLCDCNVDNNLNIDDLYVELKFKELVIIDDPVEAARELRNCWYSQMNINGVTHAAKNIGLSELTLMYSKIIKNNKLDHFRIIRITKKYVEDNPVCTMGLKKYVETEYWNELDENILGDDLITDI